MIQERIGAAVPIENGSPELLGGNRDYVAQTGANRNEKAPARRVLTAENGHFVDGNPKVVIEPRGSAILVGLTAIPWGWQGKARTCEFYNAATANRYADKLVQMLEVEGGKAHQRREAQQLARLQERGK
jgi:hypothetical protein